MKPFGDPRRDWLRRSRCLSHCSNPAAWGVVPLWDVVMAALLLTTVTIAQAEPGFDPRYERDYNIFNPTNLYAPDNPLNPINKFDPDSAFNPVNRYDPGNPVNPTNRYNSNNPFNPVNEFSPDNPLNPANRYNPNTPFAPLDGTSGARR